MTPHALSHPGTSQEAFWSPPSDKTAFTCSLCVVRFERRTADVCNHVNCVQNSDVAFRFRINSRMVCTQRTCVISRRNSSAAGARRAGSARRRMRKGAESEGRCGPRPSRGPAPAPPPGLPAPGPPPGRPGPGARARCMQRPRRLAAVIVQTKKQLVASLDLASDLRRERRLPTMPLQSDTSGSRSMNKIEACCLMTGCLL